MGRKSKERPWDRLWRIMQIKAVIDAASGEEFSLLKEFEAAAGKWKRKIPFAQVRKDAEEARRMEFESKKARAQYETPDYMKCYADDYERHLYIVQRQMAHRMKRRPRRSIPDPRSHIRTPVQLQRRVFRSF